MEEFVGHFYLFAWMLNVQSYGLMAVNRFVAIAFSMKYSIIFRFLKIIIPKIKFNCSCFHYSRRKTILYVCIAATWALVYALLPFMNVCCRNVFQLHDEYGGGSDVYNATFEAWYDWHFKEKQGFHFFDFFSIFQSLLSNNYRCIWLLVSIDNFHQFLHYFCNDCVLYEKFDYVA